MYPAKPFSALDALSLAATTITHRDPKPQPLPDASSEPPRSPPHPASSSSSSPPASPAAATRNNLALLCEEASNTSPEPETSARPTEEDPASPSIHPSLAALPTDSAIHSAPGAAAAAAAAAAATAPNGDPANGDSVNLMSIASITSPATADRALPPAAAAAAAAAARPALMTSPSYPGKQNSSTFYDSTTPVSPSGARWPQPPQGAGAASSPAGTPSASLVSTENSLPPVSSLTGPAPPPSSVRLHGVTGYLDDARQSTLPPMHAEKYDYTQQYPGQSQQAIAPAPGPHSSASPLTESPPGMHHHPPSSASSAAAAAAAARKKRQCAECLGWFSNLATHRSIHQAEYSRPHTCDVCRRGFARPNDLYRHQKSHRGDAPFRCPLYMRGPMTPSTFGSMEPPCHQNGGFSRCDTYKNHLKAMHFDYPAGTKKKQRNGTSGKCKACGASFQSSDEWIARHIETGECPVVKWIKDSNSGSNPGPMPQHAPSAPLVDLSFQQQHQPGNGATNGASTNSTAQQYSQQYSQAQAQPQAQAQAQPQHGSYHQGYGYAPYPQPSSYSQYVVHNGYTNGGSAAAAAANGAQQQGGANGYAQGSGRLMGLKQEP